MDLLAGLALTLVALGVLIAAQAVTAHWYLGRVRSRAAEARARAHRCRWAPTVPLAWPEGHTTVLLEECQECHGVRLTTRPGRWTLNGLGQWVQVTEADEPLDTLDRMWEITRPGRRNRG